MTSRLKFIAGLAVVVSAATFYSVNTAAFATYGSWANVPVYFVMNPQNLDVPPADAEAAVLSAMDTWNAVPNSQFGFAYGGRTSATTSAYDGQNVIVFRPDGDGSEIARTYSWSYGSTIVDADIVFWDGPYTFFTGTSGCGGSGYGVYIEDVATHELGHALGLLHSAVSTATMYSGYPACSTEKRSLDPDDMAAVQNLYPGSSTSPTPTNPAPATNSAPSVTINSPVNGSSYAGGATVSFSGSASDAQDGSLTGRLVWTSSIDGQIGTGGAFSKVLASGTHVVTAQVTDSGGLMSYFQTTVTIGAPVSSTSTSSGLSLTASPYKIKGMQKVDLSWTGAAASAIDVFRNGSKLTTTSNTGWFTDAINKKGSGTYSYYVCASGTSTCSSTATATF